MVQENILDDGSDHRSVQLYEINRKMDKLNSYINSSSHKKGKKVKGKSKDVDKENIITQPQEEET